MLKRFEVRNLHHLMTSRSVSFKFLEYTEHGNPASVLKLKERNLKISKPNEVLAKVLASPVNPADINTIQGIYAVKPSFPAIGGNEGVAEVLETGSEVRDLFPGDWIIPAKTGIGFWATHVLSERESFSKLSKDISPISASTLTVNPCSAYRMLRDYVDLKPENIIIQNGANSGVGQGVIQLAKEMGVITVNIIRNRPNLADVKSFLQSLGANYVLTEEEFKDKKVMEPIWKKHGRSRLALNCVGGQATLYLSTALDDGGKLVSYGGMSKQPLQVPVGPLIFKSIELYGFWITRWKSDPKNATKQQEMLNDLTELMRTGRYKEPDCERVDLENYVDVMKKSLEGFNKKQIFYFI